LISITFKDVGQGDSILFQWRVNKKLHLGLVDCNMKGQVNPILEQLKLITEEYFFDFIIISHGHTDHYSGVLGVLNYISATGKTINVVCSTLQPVMFSYLQITQSMQENKMLSALINKIEEFYNNGTIKDIFPIYNSISNFKIDGSVLKCYHPKQSDYTKLGKQLNAYIDKTSKTKPDLNYISTVFFLEFNELVLIFSSDSPKHSLPHLLKDLKDKQVLFIQVPHHGSRKNYSKSFWKSVSRIDECPVIISCGSSRHMLPNTDVIESLAKLGYKIYSTSYVNGIVEHVEGKSPEIEYTHILDSFSTIERTYSLKNKWRYHGDKIISFDGLTASVK